MFQFKEQDVELKKLEDSDLELLMSWRSNEKIYQWFYEQNEPLKWDTHYSWWKSRENRDDWIIIYNGKFRKRKIGSVNVSKLDSDYPEIGILIGELSFWGKGIGKVAVKIVLDYLIHKGYNGAKANVLENNLNSKKLFESLKFKIQGYNRKGELSYLKKF